MSTEQRSPEEQWPDIKPLADLLRGAVGIAVLWYAGVFLALACVRIPYPFELEWLEGGMAQAVQRVLEGQPLYTKPSMEYAPFIYTPLYMYVSAGLSWVMGLSFLPLRLVSFACTLGCFLVLFLFVRRETSSAFAGIGALGIYAAAYRIGGAWFDVARVDSMFVFLLLLALYLARFARTWRGYALAGVVLAAAYMTKQSAIATAIPLFMACLWTDWKRAWALVLVSVALAGGATFYLDRVSEGWYTYFMYISPLGHGTEKIMWLGFWKKDLATLYGFACAVALAALVLRLAAPRPNGFLFYFFVTGGIGAMCYASRLHAGGYDNVLLPLYAWIALLCGLMLGGGGLQAVERDGKAPLNAAAREAISAGACVLCLAQFALCLYNPFDQAPTRADREAGQRLLTLIEITDGDVLIPYHNFYPALAGKKVFAHKDGINVFLGNRRQEVGQSAYLREFQRALREKRFGLVVMNSKFLSPDVNANYTPIPSIFRDNDEFRPVTGLATRPVYFYVPKP